MLACAWKFRVDRRTRPLEALLLFMHSCLGFRVAIVCLFKENVSRIKWIQDISLCFKNNIRFRAVYQALLVATASNSIYFKAKVAGGAAACCFIHRLICIYRCKLRIFLDMSLKGVAPVVACVAYPTDGFYNLCPNGLRVLSSFGGMKYTVWFNGSQFCMYAWLIFCDHCLLLFTLA